MFVKDDSNSDSTNGEVRKNSSAASFRRSEEIGDSEANAAMRRQPVGYLSKRDEVRYRSYVAEREKVTQGFAVIGDRDKRNRVPRSTSETKSNGKSLLISQHE